MVEVVPPLVLPVAGLSEAPPAASHESELIGARGGRGAARRGHGDVHDPATFAAVTAVICVGDTKLKLLAASLPKDTLRRRRNWCR